MMSVLEYASDVNLTVDQIIGICKSLNIKVNTEDDLLTEDDIILLDNETSSFEDIKEEIEEEVEEEEELNKEITKKLDVSDSKDKMKPKQASKKIARDDSKYLKEKKEMYKHKEKLSSNKNINDTNIIVYKNQMTVKDLAEELNVNTNEIIKKLFDLGMIVNINQSLDYETAELIVVDYNKKLKNEEKTDIINFEEYEIIDKDEDLEPRPPVVTIMGHVDHGKTSLLDAIRNTNVVDKEAGGITQSIGAYQVKVHDKLITFIDTPGHEAFTAMRARGASVTDIVIIIVSAVDGIKPQTVEAIDHAKAANVPIIVAINKMDLPGANPERVLQELTEYGLTPEDWGGDTLVNKISAKTKEGIDDLLDNILLIAELKNLRANKNRYATGTVIESRLDKNIGAVCSILIQNGTLRLGDPVVVGNFYGKIRTLKNDRGENILNATPSTPVEITGLNDLPVSGDKFMAFETEKEARKVSDERILRHKEANTNRNGMTLDDLFSKVQDGAKKINIVLKTDEQNMKQKLTEVAK